MDKAKRGYQEKKQILAKHVQTEKTLTTQAKQLMDVANVATKDVYKLHETIARRKNYDFNNREACKNLDINLNSHLNAMTGNIDEYKSMLNDQTLSLINKMGKSWCISFGMFLKSTHFKKKYIKFSKFHLFRS